MKARWRLALAVFSSVVLLVLAVSLILPKNYKATATIVADLKPDPLTGLSQMAAMQQSGFLTTQADIIQSAHVAQRVVKQFKMEDNAESRESWQRETGGRGDYRAWMAELIGRSLIVKPSRDSNVLEITYKSVNAPFAVAMANAFAKSYIDTVVQMRVDPARGYSDFFEERARLAREKLEKAQTKLAEAQRERGIVATDERLDAETAKLNEIAAQVVSTRALVADNDSRTTQAVNRADQMQDIINNPVVAGLKSDLVRSQAKLQELSERLGSNHPQVVELKANIAETQTRINSEVRRISSSLNINSDMSRSRLKAAEAAYEEQRNRLLKLKEQRAALSFLDKEVEQAQRIYEVIQMRLSQTNLESNSAQSNIYLLSPATEPSDPSSPKVLLNTLISVVPATMLMLLAVLVAEVLDRRVRGTLDVTHLLELPVIGIMQSPSGKVKKAASHALMSWGKKKRGGGRHSGRGFSEAAGAIKHVGEHS